MKTPTIFILLSILALPLLLAACSALDPADDAAPIHERRLIGDEAAVHGLAGATSSNPDLLAGDGDEVQLVEGQRVVLPALDATLTFVRKTDDSRCPANVICVWEGEAAIQLKTTRSSQTPVSFEIAGFVGPDGNQQSGQGLSHEAFGLRFTLLRLDPYPLVDVEQTDPVTATIRVEVL